MQIKAALEIEFKICKKKKQNISLKKKKFVWESKKMYFTSIKVVRGGVNNVYGDNFFICCMWIPYHITYSIGTNKLYVTRQIKEI